MDAGEALDDLTALGDLLIEQILSRATSGEIKDLIEQDAPLWYQNDEGVSALHAAAYVQDSDLMHRLIERGAVWNAVDNLNNTAGDIALSLNDTECYEIVRSAGIRTELILALLSSKNDTASPVASSLILKTSDSTAAGSSDTFLSSRLKFTRDQYGQDICVVDAGGEEVGVMMGWEREIMQETVRKTCLDHDNLHSGLKVLNVGFGLGIIDSIFEVLPVVPSQHVIIEAHPDVLEHMKNTGWFDKPNVKVLAGKWQDLIGSDDILSVGGFDVVYTDTFAEDYSSLRAFFESLPDLLAGPDSRFSFFNGLGATNALFYDVFTHLAELNLAEVGIDVVWSDVRVTFDGEDEERWGKTRQYFTLPIYRLPVGTMRIS